MPSKIPFLRILPAFFVLFFSNAYALKTLVIINNNTNQENTGPLRLISSTPYDRQVVSKSPESISFTFSQPIKPDKSSIKVLDAYGHPVETGELEANGKSMSVALPELSYGKYSVKWRVRCLCDADTLLNDTVRFTIR